MQELELRVRRCPDLGQMFLNGKGEGMGQFMDVHQTFSEGQAALLSENATKNKTAVVCPPGPPWRGSGVMWRLL